MRADLQALARYTYPAGAAAFMQEICLAEDGRPFALTAWEREVTRAIYERENRPRVGIVGTPRGGNRHSQQGEDCRDRHHLSESPIAPRATGKTRRETPRTPAW